MTYLTDLADVLRRAGLTVVEIPGWKTRGRPGTFAPIGVLCHHTAGASDSRAYAEWMATVGRDDLPAPLAQLGLSRTGIFYVLAAGRANHAGKCKPIAGLKAYPGRDYGDGNAQLVGIEAMNTGSEGWTTAQYDAYVRGCAALNTAYGFPASRTLAHRETSLSGKPDPGGISMPTFRAQVASVDLATTSPEEDVMNAAQEAVQREILANIKGLRAEEAARYSSNYTTDAERTARLEAAIAAVDDIDVTELAAALSAQRPEGGTVSKDDLTAALREVLRSIPEPVQS